MTDEQREKGVATHSSGNHGQALAWAASQAGLKAFVVMPENAPEVKKAAVLNYGAEVVECASSLKAREETLEKVLNARGATFVPPYNFQNTIEGQSTAAMEVFEDFQDIDYLLCPVGGGGLLSGSALSAHFFSPDTKVIGCEPAMADDAYRSFNSGRLVPSVAPDTIADGLQTSLGPITFEYIRKYVHDILLSPEDEIREAMKMVWERMKIVIEASAAVPMACLLKNKERFSRKKVAVILSGGNVDLARLPF